jgi:hypothetical protein
MYSYGRQKRKRGVRYPLLKLLLAPKVAARRLDRGLHVDSKEGRAKDGLWWMMEGLVIPPLNPYLMLKIRWCSLL